MAIDDGGPAFPCGGDTFGFVARGMTLRDYFAAKALTGILSDPSAEYEGVLTTDPDCDAKLQTQRLGIAAYCYHFADAMLSARKAGTTE